MGPTAILDDIVRKTQDIVRGALPPGRSREAAVVKLRELLLAREITAALAISSDNFVAFAIRESRVHLADQTVPPDRIISTLWEILDYPSGARLNEDFCRSRSAANFCTKS
jgi:hypothetical protein